MAKVVGVFKTVPYQHQKECLEISIDKPVFAYFLEQGLGKSKVLLDTASFLHKQCKIHTLVVVAPNGVHLNWATNEIPKHLSEDHHVFVWSSKRVNTKRFKNEFDAAILHKGFVVYVVNIEALSSGMGAKWLADFVKMRNPNGVLFAIDESSRIKTPSSRCTKNVSKIARPCAYRRIMTGTPVTQSPFDLFSQMAFLDPRILGFTSYFAFKHTFGVWESQMAVTGGRTVTYERLVEHKNLDKLQGLIAPWSFRRTKKECLDLPEKVYQQIFVELSPTQRKMYNQIKEEGELIIPDDFRVLAPLQITRLLRAQQIIGGFLPEDDQAKEIHMKQLPGGNPKLSMLLDLIDDYPGKAIIWARFRAELELISEALKEHGVVQLHGGVQGANRTEAVRRFQEDDDVRFLVGQQASGIGVTLTEAQTVFYFSNTFSSEHRKQSEDRAHRIGLKHTVVYVDLIAEDTIDGRIVEVLTKADKLARLVLQDDTRPGAGNDSKHSDTR